MPAVINFSNSKKSTTTGTAVSSDASHLSTMSTSKSPPNAGLRLISGSFG